ncbi:MAG: hypothetical protein J0H31_19930 [Alphaproteobacteria bacterium]|nr:hypothetical protein [Alphaproteobacteria bacterium]
MLPEATDDAAPSSWRGHRNALDMLRRRVARQLSVDPGKGVESRRVLFSLGRPSADLHAALGALDDFERAILENEDRVVIEARRLKCLAILDRIGGPNKKGA